MIPFGWKVYPGSPDVPVRPDFKVPEAVLNLRKHLETCNKFTEPCNECKTLEALCPHYKTWWKPGDPVWGYSKLDPGFIYAPFIPE